VDLDLYKIQEFLVSTVALLTAREIPAARNDHVLRIVHAETIAVGCGPEHLDKRGIIVAAQEAKELFGVLRIDVIGEGHRDYYRRISLQRHGDTVKKLQRRRSCESPPIAKRGAIALSI
jgi:hypothetical protein